MELKQLAQGQTKARELTQAFSSHIFQICKIIQDSVTSDLQPYLQTLPGRTPHPSLGYLIFTNFYKCIHVPYKTLHGIEVLKVKIKIPFSPHIFFQEVTSVLGVYSQIFPLNVQI